MRLCLACILLSVGIPAFAQESATEQKIREAMTSDVRSEADMARDRNRKPVETLSFFGLSDDMTVLELLPGGGWYTKLLAPVLRDDGELYVAIGVNNVLNNLVPQEGFDHINVIDIGRELERSGPFGTRYVAPFDFGIDDVDLVVTFRNMHNFTPEGRANINAAVYNSLKSGGHYGVIDHTLRHMQQMTAENRRRTDPVQIVKEVLDAGFEFVGYSDLHYRPDDELRFEVGRASVTGNTDRYTFLFRKP
jgi:predicted methyltransferase